MPKNHAALYHRINFFTIYLCRCYYRDLLSALRIFHSRVLCYMRLYLPSSFASNANIISVLAVESRDVNREGLYLNITLSFADTIY